MIHESVYYNLLLSNGINKQDVLSILNDCQRFKIDYADIYFQSIFTESWILENKIIKENKYHIDQGFSIRVILNETTGFSYSDNINLNELVKHAKQACSFSCLIDQKKKIKYVEKYHNHVYSQQSIINSFTEIDKVHLLNYINSTARKIDHRVSEVRAILNSVDENILIVSTDGILSSDIRPLFNLSISVLVENNGKREYGNSGGGGRTTYNFLYQENNSGKTNLDFWIHSAVEMALLNLSAKSAPSGTFPVVLGSGWPGILIHEAVGHGLEADFNLKKSSIFYNQMNKKIASSLCTIVDDGTMLNQRGSISIDDEGTVGQYNILVKNGILKKYMQDKLTSRLMHVPVTGNGRRESYAYLPRPRMTNTYMLPGKSTFLEIIDTIKYGILALNFSGGQVDTTSGRFVFSTSKAFLLKNGKIMYPIKGATLIGSGIEVMNAISMVADDFLMDSGTGICMKDGQSVPVGVGQPTVKLSQLTIGGTV
ncbi:metalloprotease TldD [Buchnera aphidicola]|uniref:metalloprotease TldD n=1 Tax=Buchnera aphidicola TaxID=9 RepID=UPI0031B824B7